MPPAPSADMPIDKEFQNELRLLCEAGVRVIHLLIIFNQLQQCVKVDRLPM